MWLDTVKLSTQKHKHGATIFVFEISLKKYEERNSKYMSI
jgi:hypothetical protein